MKIEDMAKMMEQNLKAMAAMQAELESLRKDGTPAPAPAKVGPCWGHVVSLEGFIPKGETKPKAFQHIRIKQGEKSFQNKSLSLGDLYAMRDSIKASPHKTADEYIAASIAVLEKHQPEVDAANIRHGRTVNGQKAATKATTPPQAAMVDLSVIFGAEAASMFADA